MLDEYQGRVLGKIRLRQSNEIMNNDLRKWSELISSHQLQETLNYLHIAESLQSKEANFSDILAYINLVYSSRTVKHFNDSVLEMIAHNLDNLGLIITRLGV